MNRLNYSHSLLPLATTPLLMGLLCCALILPARAQSAYVQVTTTADRIANWCDLQVKDSHPNSIYLATANWNPNGVGGVYDNHPIGVWYDAWRADWAVFNQDQAAMPLGAAFNMCPLGAASNCYVHHASAANSAGDYTVLDNLYTNHNPYAVVFVTPIWNPGGSGGVYDSHNIGVWYNPAIGRWAIFNQDHTAIPNGAAFNVWTQPRPWLGGGYYQHRATSANSVSNWTFLDNVRTNNNPYALIEVTPVWNPGGVGGVYNNHAIGVWYDRYAGKWAIFNQDLTPIPGGSAFNVYCIP